MQQVRKVNLKNFWLSFCILLVLAVSGGGIHLYLSAGDIIKEIVETVATNASDTKVVVDTVDVTIHKGEISMMGIRVKNAPPFQNSVAIRIDNIELKIKPDTLTDDVIIIDEIRVSGIHTRYERDDKFSNVDLIQNKIDSFRKNPDRQRDKINFNNYYKSLKFIIRNLTLQGGQISIMSDKLAGKKASLPFPNLNRENFTEKKEGIALNTVIGEIFGVIIDHISASGHSGLRSALERLQPNSKPTDINVPMDIVK